MKLDADIHNYMETLLTQVLDDYPLRVPQDEQADLCCLVLNRHPPRYVRHDVDTAFFMTEDDVLALKAQLRQSIAEVEEYLASAQARQKA
ncbi:late competence development ComFB family protein [Gallaecimonas sp. GXIMD4217]|uniref:late competence development ComFB family protein n=1 Tax=Gallaecimonas sp. GXIMD4217 TaxID=3131927 RepID=UPI00311ACB39